MSCRVWLADKVVTKVCFIAKRIRGGRHSALRVIAQMCHVAKIVGCRERLTDFRRLRVAPVGCVVERCGDRRGRIVAGRNKREHIAETTEGKGRGGRAAAIWGWARDRLNQAAWLVIANRRGGLSPFLNAGQSSQREVCVVPGVSRRNVSGRGDCSDVPELIVG